MLYFVFFFLINFAFGIRNILYYQYTIMALEITGKLHEVFPTQKISDTFSKREFVLEISEQAANGMTYTNYASFQLVNNQCAVMDQFQVGEQVKVNFNIRGNRWEKDGQVRYITNLNAWRVERPGMTNNYPQGGYQQAPQQGTPQNNSFNQPAPPFGNDNGSSDDDLPF